MVLTKNNRTKPQDTEISLAARFLREEIKGREVLCEDIFDLERDGQLAVAVIKDGDRYQVILIANISGPLVFHWGVSRQTPHEWLLPSDPIQPAGTVVFEKSAAQTPFVSCDGLNRLRLEFNKEDVPIGIPFVLKQPDTARWLKDHGHNFYIPVVSLSREKRPPFSPRCYGIADEIIEAEVGRHSWTLMHRFNLCHDLLDRVKDSIEGLALIFVWLRFSAIRQLDWQRNYNTKPRELSHAMDRLTLKLADIYRESEPAFKNLIRLILTTVGRGGEGQRIRDEILSIMHRHKIKEVLGSFIEEWHQKLHNNTTPDDMVICEAYLDFLKSDGDLGVFYRALMDRGVTRERLKSFDRPIVTDPDFVPYLKEVLIRDFENYLSVLKSVHSGTDLESAVNSSRYILDSETNNLLDFIWQHQNDKGIFVEDLIDRISEVRRRVDKFLEKETENRGIRDLLFLDLALEESLRIMVERNIHLHLGSDRMVELTGMVLENFLLGDDGELRLSSRQWKKLKRANHSGRERALQAKSVIDRLMRIMRSYIDYYYQIFQPKAEFFGKAFHADTWTITIFSEEVIRGRLEFVLSMLLRHLEPLLREEANLGNWQVISPSKGAGWVEVIDVLGSIQGKRFDNPTIIIADKIKGDEEPPQGVTGIITKDITDIVSHVAVRARNLHLLFATCYDKVILDHLKSCKGRWLNLWVDVSGDVIFEENEEKTKTDTIPPPRLSYTKIVKPDFFSYAISSKDFNERLVGGKSNNLVRLKGNLPDWIHIPASVALPFGVFEMVLAEERNKEIARHYNELINRLDNKPGEILARIREILLHLEPPDELIPTLQKVMSDEGLVLPERWDDAWLCIKRVWASKWNERAYFSREARGILHDDIFMAVLIQEVVDADYAFVIHTVNPSTGEMNELYAEVVSGLGETLVGNYPGRAFSFTSHKVSMETQILAYPSKSIGLYGGGLIFRSDSNGEDLAEYAGAGLYDSVMFKPPKEVLLDYADEPLIRDENFRKGMMTAISIIGLTIENALGSSQDIEGTYTKGKYYVVQTRPQVGIKSG